MADFAESLLRIDPTKGLIDYVNTVKPYHSKILDVLVEYIYEEKVDVVVEEDWKWNLTFTTRTDQDVVYSCGYGYRWDPTGITTPESQPVSFIVSATGKLYIDASTTVGSAIISITRNTTAHQFSMYDGVVFTTDTTTPFISESLLDVIAPGQTYYVNPLTSSTFEVYANVNVTQDINGNTVISGFVGSPIVFNTTDNVYVTPQNLQYNTFLVQQTQTTSAYVCLATNTVANQLSFVDGFNITGVNPLLKQWTVDIAPTLSPGDVVYINGNSTVIANKKYTVASVLGNTVTVNEPLPPLTQTDGKLYTVDAFDNIPYWPSGLKVKVSSTGTLPAPLSAATTYYFIPSATVGTFNLARKRYPQQLEDYVDLSTVGEELLIQRAEPFTPGNYVTVEGSYLHQNDGKYIISTVEPEGDYFRIGVYQNVKRTTPSPLPALHDGAMILNHGAYDMPTVCPAIRTPELYAGTFVHENLQFRFSISEKEFIGAVAVENETGGWGNSLYNTLGVKLEPYTTTTNGSSSGSITQLLLPTGFDTQLFDVGSMDEDLSYTSMLQVSYPAL